jgi:hypothetical protein
MFHRNPNRVSGFMATHSAPQPLYHSRNTKKQTAKDAKSAKKKEGTANKRRSTRIRIRTKFICVHPRSSAVLNVYFFLGALGVLGGSSISSSARKEPPPLAGGRL